MNAQCSATRHRILRIQKQIEKDLLQLARVTENARQVRLKRYFQLHPRGLELVLEQGKSVVDNLVQIQLAEFGSAGARKVQQPIHDLRCAERLLSDFVEQRTQPLIAANLLGQHLRIGGDDRERCIHFVRDAGGKQADGGELLRLSSCASSSMRSLKSSTRMIRPTDLKLRETSGAIAMFAMRASPARVFRRNLYRL